MSEIGWKSAGNAASAASIVAVTHGLPTSAASTPAARFGVAAMPPKAMRAMPTLPSPSIETRNAPQSAEMSSSRRLDTL